MSTTNTFTATAITSYRTPNKKELEEEILFKIMIYARMKWYQPRGEVLRDIKRLCRTLEIIERL